MIMDGSFPRIEIIMAHTPTPHTTPDFTTGQHLIIGASRGIGLAWVHHLLAHSPATEVIAAGRSASTTQALMDLQRDFPDRLGLMDVDITQPQSVGDWAQRIAPKSLSAVINTTGVLHDQGQGLRPEKRLEDIDLGALETVMRINAWGTALLMPALFGKLRTDQPAVFAAISARVGSIGDNRIGGWYAYRASKAALNQLIKTASIEAKRRYPNLIVAALHPGTTDTDLSKPFQGNVPEDKLFSPEFVAERLVAVLQGLSLDDSGGFFAWDGEPIPF